MAAEPQGTDRWCTHCKHIQRDAAGFAGTTCLNPKSGNSPVTGKPRFWSAATHRSMKNNPRFCGGNGSWWEQSQTPT